MTSAAPTQHAKLLAWVEDCVKLCKPDSVYWCDGSKEEYDRLCSELVTSGTFVKLNEKLRPNSYLARSTEDDVARVEERTFICTPTKDEAGPTNNWMEPAVMKDTLTKLFDGSMKGRKMYIIPLCMGHLNSAFGKIAVQITDSAYVVTNMYIMVRAMGKSVIDALGKDGEYVPCLHSVGAPLESGQKDVPWPCNHKDKYIVHFPQEPSIMSYGSGYGGNALLGKKCLALRIASYQGNKEGWMAEHCLIMKLKSPEGKVYYIAGGFPSACGKTNLSMLIPTIPGWKVETIGDDIAWMRVGDDGRLYAINPEFGFFGLAPGTSELTNAVALASLRANSIFTNVALTPEGDVWWEDLTKTPPPVLEDWLHKPWNPTCGRKAAHPNSRFTAPAGQSPMIAPEWNDPKGVPISAIIFGGRRSTLIPLVTESFSWQHGVFLGSVCSSETTTAAVGQVGVLRRDPFAMLPFCGYNMGDYFAHWLEMGKKLGPKAPKLFYVNWFRKDKNGKWMWPGFGENSRVLKWICERCDGVGRARETPVGYVPESLDLTGTTIKPETIKELTTVNASDWLPEVEDIKKYYGTIGSHLPKELQAELTELETRCKSS
eukprot:TRINITY_DN8091_c0_g1_i1.p1 TRINITY_DN8091_c0_g1~~TRINITY_DN8091_c0_g1_i1.p1  ORF type:complete len:600 (+),score=155.32 TRINITY_DN8091_c0_g1_i1:60-1859(+)